MLRPAAAVWALRVTGEKRLLSLLVVAVFAVSVPAWWSRIGHAALTSHFTILPGLGLYLRLVTSANGLTPRPSNPPPIELAPCILACMPMTPSGRTQHSWW